MDKVTRMKKSTFNFCIIITIAFGWAHANDKVGKFPSVIIESPYEACKGVVIVSEDKYKANQEKWDNWNVQCGKFIQVSEEAGIFQILALSKPLEYIALATKVAEKVISNLDKNQKYSQCTALCFKGALTCSAETSGSGKTVDCKIRQAEISHGLKVQSRKIRMELALSQVASNLEKINVNNVFTLADDKRFNKNLLSFEAITPNPVGNSKMQPAELLHAREVIKNERAKMEKDYQQMLRIKNIKDTNDIKATWMVEQIDKRREEHQEKYRSLIYEESPIFALIGQPSKIENGDEPVWSDKQIADGFIKLAENAAVAKATAKESIYKNKLEFSRLNGEALWNWARKVTGSRNRNDILYNEDKNELLYYMGMSKQVNEVLKEDKSLCAAASTLTNRLSSKEIQNLGVVFTASLAVPLGGPLTVFRISKVINSGQISALTGAAVGIGYLGDAFEKYNTKFEEVTAGVATAIEFTKASDDLKTNLIFTPTFAPVGKILNRIIYAKLAEKNAQDFPEIAALMKKAGANRALQEQAADLWMRAKIKESLKKGIIGSEDERALKSETGKNLLNLLATEIQKNNSKFFNDPRNFDFFLEAAAVSLKRRPGDPADLGEKARQLFLSLNVDAFQTWDPKARTGLMKVFNEGVKELRTAYTKDPAAYAKFTTDPASQKKIMLAALERAGVTNAKDRAAMLMCSLKKGLTALF